MNGACRVCVEVPARTGGGLSRRVKERRLLGWAPPPPPGPMRVALIQYGVPCQNR